EQREKERSPRGIGELHRVTSWSVDETKHRATAVRPPSAGHGAKARGNVGDSDAWRRRHRGSREKPRVVPRGTRSANPSGARRARAVAGPVAGVAVVPRLVDARAAGH